MGIFDVFTGQPAKDAAASQQGLYKFVDERNRGDINTGLTSATGYVQGGTQRGLADLGFGYNAGTGAINSGSADALNYLNNNASAPLTALGQKYGAGTNTYLDSLGINGPEGNTRATSAFQAGPGYDFTLNQGIDAINRRRNASGMLNSGNADRDAQIYGTGLANQTYGDWQNRLGGLVNPELAATSGAAQLDSITGRAQATVAGQRGQMLSELASRYGTGMAGLDTGEGNTLAGLATGAAGQNVGSALNLAGPYGKTYSDSANASLAGQANAWKFGIEGAKLLAGAAGGVSGGGSLGGLFGGGVDPIASAGGVRWI